MARCSGSTPDGTPCRRIVGASQKYCYAHDPHHQKARSRAASKAARSKPSKELQDVKRQLQSLADGVRDGELDRADAAVVGQLLNGLLRALEVERKWRELGDVEDRLSALEEARRGSPGGQHWGA